MTLRAAVPDWLVSTAGEAPVLFVAPHGGRRPARRESETSATRKVNDLHTAEITLEMAGALQAPAVVNPSEDRNRVDLNRVSHVRARAPWLLELLLEAVRAQIAAVGEATVLFIHGWNAIQPSCDVGIGARVADDALVPVKQGVPTVPRRFLPRLAAFAEAARRGGIEVTLGHRYPAAGRDNMLQVFTSRFAGDDDPRIAELARLGAAGRISAVQLELAVPLRWPGPLRCRAIEAIRHLAAPENGGAASLGALESPRLVARPADHLALEFHDGHAGVGGFAAAERSPSGRRLGRLLLCLGPRRLGLFTGEDPGRPSGELGCMGLEWTRRGEHEARLAYQGPCLTFPRTDPFLDLEAGLAEAEIGDLDADLVWRPMTARGGPAASLARLGRIEGRIRLDRWTASISAPAALQDGVVPPPASWHEHRALRIPLGSDTFLSISSRRTDGETIQGQIVHGGRLEPLLSGRVSLRNSANGLAPAAWRVEAVSRSGTLRVFGHVTHAIPVVRPSLEGKVLTVFGLARFGAERRVGYGTFEHSQRLDRKGSAP
ncbi:MAG: hypothetical protein HYY35_02335 [Deltaproteobacteria bacterium]|nr:hypothetical protein [Deltaproteobacteria bacterium]